MTSANLTLEKEGQASTWEVREGVMIAYGTTPAEVAEFLHQNNVVAELDWFNSTAHVLGINVLCNESEGIASLDSPSSLYTVGCTLSELVEALANRFSADVRIGQKHTNQLPEGVQVERGDVSAERMVRVVEISDIPLSAVPFCASAEDLTLAAINLEGDRRAVCYEVSAADFSTDLVITKLPVVMLCADKRDQKIIAINEEENGKRHKEMHSWLMNTQVIAGAVAKPAANLSSLIRADFGHSKSPRHIAGIASCDAEKLAKDFTVNGKEGLTSTAQTLGLTPDILAFLNGNLELESIGGAQVFYAPSWIDAWKHSVDMRQERALSSGPLPAVRYFAAKYPLVSKILNGLEGALGVSLLALGIAHLFRGRRYGKRLSIAGLFLSMGAALNFALAVPVARLVGDFYYKKTEDGR